ncbi:MAG: hydrolase 1, exosortase A system-associated [Sphingomonadales bacterium]|jgi:exosortase A-associated hydrolase 1|nr:hydrolase 1, exosortase A system-associated [Sphingomonadales bacterium]MBK9002402.1 hydrolase 1, exosortase A system-associated [Sphingomonadales bacterium]MBK9267632.1 hydrolase 1, exosortase A system-associated [Sphingomonadales bacterium]MBP6435006.1 hydrolase 1, exosortase A system-associated [Sphingorhabdus sp.]
MRRLTGFDCEGAWCAATLDEGERTTGLLIVSGGNEIRSGAHAGQAALAAHFAASGYPVFRYDRRGVGESEGENGGFESSAADIAAAAAAFRAQVPQLQRIVAFGNCDAASSLALFHAGLPIDRLVLANPWVIEARAEADAPAPPSAAAIRARYWARLKNPRSLIDLFSGRIDLGKLAGGLARAARKEAPTGLAQRIGEALSTSTVPATLLLASRDTTALAFTAAWKSSAFDVVRQRGDVNLQTLDSASHSFADADSKAWLCERIEAALAD